MIPAERISQSGDGVVGRLHGFRHGLGVGEFRHIKPLRVHCLICAGPKRRTGPWSSNYGMDDPLVQDRCAETTSG